MTTYNEQETMQGVAQRFVQAAEELRLSGAQLYRDGIVKNDQVLSKIKNGWQKPTKKAIEQFCEKYGVSAAWLYTGEGNHYINRSNAFEHRVEMTAEMAGDLDFWSVNTDKSLAPVIMSGDVIALKKLSTWKEYIPGDFICLVVTSEYKVLRKVSVTQNDDQSISFIQMVDGTPVESKIPKDIITDIYKVVGNYRRQ